jgi:hypothetical protein
VEEKSELREPTVDEWNQLLLPEWHEENKTDFNLDYIIENPPKTKYINKESRNKLIEVGLVYMMSGKNAGMIRYKVTKTKKDFSGDKLMWLFYEKLRLPKQFKLRKNKEGKKKSASLDEDSLRKLMYRYPAAVEPGQIILEFRGKKKELDYLKGAYDKDGRVRCQYKQTTAAGRLASAKNPMRTGMNLQNLKR